jgi:hypothetical protein
MESPLLFSLRGTAMDVTENEPGVCSTRVACALLMLTQPRLYQLEKAGWFKRLGPNRWRVVDLVQGYIKFLKDEERRTSKTATLGRVQEARARGLERKNLIAEGKLCDVDEMLQDIDELISPLMGRLGGLPAECTRDLGMRAVIQQKIDAIRTEYADRAAALAAEYGAKARGEKG